MWISVTQSGRRSVLVEMCIRDREYWAAKKGQLALDKENAAREAAGQPTKPTKFVTDKAKLRRTIRQALYQACLLYTSRCV